MVELTQRGEVLFQAGFDAFAGADHRGARRIEPRIGRRAAPRIAEPQHSRIGEIRSDEDLQESQKNEKIVHANRG